MKTSEIPIHERLQIYERALVFMKTVKCAGLCHAVYQVIKEIDPSIEPVMRDIDAIKKHPMGKYIMTLNGENYPELIIQRPSYPQQGYVDDMSFWWPSWLEEPRIPVLELAIRMCKRGISGYEE